MRKRHHSMRKGPGRGPWLPRDEGELRGINRRRFVKTASGILVAAGLGCSDAGPESGTVSISVTGLDGASDGGQATVSSLDDPSASPVTVDIPASGVGETKVPAGRYRVSYLPPTGFELAVGVANPRDVTVNKDSKTTLSYQVVAIVQEGTLRITVTGLASSASDGGSAQVTRTDISGQSPIVVTVPASGTVDTTVSAGTYSVTYSPPAGYGLDTGVTNPQDADITDGQTTEVTFDLVVTSTSMPGDIYDFGFEDGTGGDFDLDGGGPDSGTPWVIDATTAALGVNSIARSYAVSGGNVGNTIGYSLPSPTQHFFCRFAYRQSNPFNQNNVDTVKLNRGKGAGFTGIFGSFLIRGGSNAGKFWWFWDDLDSTTVFYANANLPAPNANDFLGEWHWYEIERDISVSGALVVRVWIDDVLYFDYQSSISNQGKTYGAVSTVGVVNSMAEVSSAWVDQIGFSSQKMGIPT